MNMTERDRDRSTQRARILKTDLQSESDDIISQRLYSYLSVMGLTSEQAEQWQVRAQFGGGNATQVFARLRLLISEHWQRGVDLPQSGITDASVMPRLRYWLEPTHEQGAACLKTLFDTPPIHRRSMIFDRWDN